MLDAGARAQVTLGPPLRLQTCPRSSLTCAHAEKTEACKQCEDESSSRDQIQRCRHESAAGRRSSGHPGSLPPLHHSNRAAQGRSRFYEPHNGAAAGREPAGAGPAPGQTARAQWPFAAETVRLSASLSHDCSSSCRSRAMRLRKRRPASFVSTVSIALAR